jgi:tetratricopeptide (TPR) repeat protein
MVSGALHSPASPALAAVLALRAGRRREALAGLAEAQRRAPGDPRITHLLLLACNHTLRDGQTTGRLTGEETAALEERVIASWVALLHQDRFWTSWLDERLRHYGGERPELATVRQELVAELTVRIEDLGTASHDPARFRTLLQREVGAAGQLAAAGGFPWPDAAAEPLVCGPLMIQILGCEESFGAFVAALPAGDETAADRVRGLFQRLLDENLEPAGRPLLTPDALERLRRWFSHLGLAEALLALDRIEEARATLDKMASAECQDAFDRNNPGYAGWPEKAARLEQDARELAVRIRLALAHAAMTAPESDAGAVAQHFREALRLAAALGRQEEIESHVVDAVLGRVKALGGKGGLAPAIELLAATRESCAEEAAGGPAPAPREQLTGRLAELLVRRGVEAGNDRRWEEAVTDLRRAATLNPHAAGPLLNLSFALAARARQLRRTAPAQAIELALEAMQQLQPRLPDFVGQPAARERFDQARETARRLILHRADELAAAGGFEQSLQVLEQGLAVMTGDPRLGNRHRETVLRYSRTLDERGQSERALAVLRRAK